MDVNEKMDLLKSNLTSLESLVVAFSGGVDSTFLLKVAHDVMGEKLLGVIIRSSTFPRRELQEALNFVQEIGVNYQVIEAENLDIAGFADNPINRCYLCKRDLFTNVWSAALENNIKWVADGSNYDDTADYRPGMTALRELGVISPLLEAELSKADIRNLSRQMQLKTWDKPAAACLSSRFAYGQRISPEKLRMVELAEEYLTDLGFKQLRVRIHDDLARIEVAPEERNKFYDETTMNMIHTRFKTLGFAYTCLDLVGYRTGSMNEIIKLEDTE